MQQPGIILVHGYTGSPDDMLPLSRALRYLFGVQAVRPVCLPDHSLPGSPRFTADRFEQAIVDALDEFHHQARDIVIIGHSTGGNLALNALCRAGVLPGLVVLAATPQRVESGDVDRWDGRRRKGADIKLIDVARMVAYINRTATARLSEACPVILVNGKDDDLVGPHQAEYWRNNLPANPLRMLKMPGAGHDLFTGAGNKAVIDYICRGVQDMLTASAPGCSDGEQHLEHLEGKILSRFMNAHPWRRFHVMRSASAANVSDGHIQRDSTTEVSSLQLNIEITTRCNLRCAHCARTLNPRQDKDMPLEVFACLLGLLPNVYHIILVGLGEPTLHANIVEMVDLAVRHGHKVSLVTNAMTLDAALAGELISAGIQAVTFSLDSVSTPLADIVRPGSDLKRILKNIRMFTSMAAGEVSTAVFSAVSIRNLDGLPDMARKVAGSGVDAWMLSDLNFMWNQDLALAQNWSPSVQATLKRTLREAFGLGLPVLSVRALEEIGLAHRFREFLITAPSMIAHRSASVQSCKSPWQTLPVDVNANAYLCDCQAEARIGNLLEMGFGEIWNGSRMQDHRRQMTSESPPAACISCPRF